MDDALTRQFPPEFLPHFDGLVQGQIQLPNCRACDRFHWYPMPLCPHCQSSKIEWRAVVGDAKLYSWTVVRHAFHPLLRDALPYVVALVTFDDAPDIRLVTNLTGSDSDAWRCDMALKPVFDSEPNTLPKVKFRSA